MAMHVAISGSDDCLIKNNNMEIQLKVLLDNCYQIKVRRLNAFSNTCISWKL